MARKINQDLILEYLKHVQKGEYPANIAEKLKKDRSRVSRALRDLERQGYLKRTVKYPAFYDLTPQGKILYLRRNGAVTSLPVNNSTIPFFKKSINYHDFKVKLPIIEHGQVPEGGKRTPINGWIKRYYKVELPIKLTLELTTRSVILHFNALELPNTSSFYTSLYRWYILGTFGAVNYLKKFGYSVDLFSAKVISQHIANRTNKVTDKHVPDSTVTSLLLGRPAATLTGEAKQEAEARLDKSLRAGSRVAEVETNDLTYEEKILRMPESVEQLLTLMGAVELYTAQIKRHLAVMEHIEKSLDSMDKTMLVLREKATP